MAASSARNSPIVFFLDRAWWAWNGWTAVAAIMAGSTAVGALVTLWFFWQQLKGIREQAQRDVANRRDDVERASTPFVSIEVNTVGRIYVDRRPARWWRRRSGAAAIGVTLWVHVDGFGPAYNLIVNLLSTAGPAGPKPAIAMTRFMRAPDSKVLTLLWLADPGETYPVYIDVTFRSMFGKQIRFRHTGFLSEKELRIGDLPEFLPA